MNLIVLFDSDFITPTRVHLKDRRMVHILEILKAEQGQMLTVGKINGLMGQGTVISQKADGIELDVKLNDKPPEALPLTLILALPRPPMLKRILFSAAMLGVKKIIILNFNRVEKSLWNSSSLRTDVITEQLILGLEQSKDTVMPEVTIKKGFKPFVQDELPALIKDKIALVAHPDKKSMSFSDYFCHSRDFEQGEKPRRASGNPAMPIILIIGPEGGIIDYEIESLKTAGCQTLDLGPRILRTEAVLPFVVGKIFDV